MLPSWAFPENLPVTTPSSIKSEPRRMCIPCETYSHSLCLVYYHSTDHQAHHGTYGHWYLAELTSVLVAYSLP